MDTEVGFLAAQLMGGAPAAAATRARAGALLQLLAGPVAELQPHAPALQEVRARGGGGDGCCA
jgi:PI-3-kinase-related kinase SMG-1